MKAVLRSIKTRLYFVVIRYFLFWGRIVHRRWAPITIAITGSVGKTTMLNILEQQLKGTAKYSHNANSGAGIAFDLVGETGVYGSRLKWLRLLVVVPIKALYYNHPQKYYVVEIDADRPKEAGIVAKALEPDTTLWVSLSLSHSVNFESAAAATGNTVLETIATEFAQVAAHTSGSVYVDKNDSLMVKAAKKVSVRVVAVQSNVLKYSVDKSSSVFVVSGGKFMFNQPQPKELGTQLAFLQALSKSEGLTTNYDMADMRVPPGRTSCLKALKGSGIVDSSYNAHFQSMETIINMFASIKHPNKVLVIGDIIEQGKRRQTENKQLAKLLSKQKVSKIILVGRRTKKDVFPALLKNTNVEVLSYTAPADAAEHLLATNTGKELYLFKGSQFLEGIIKQMLANPDDENLLCRRGANAQAARELRGIG